MDELISGHKFVMDKYDPEKRVSISVDEWGAWHAAEPGTNPSFLYQQNTMRDAVVAAVSLNIFNKHSDRVRMANLAQMVNVLQSVILTDGAQMVLTPTYHVFELYKGHQGAALVESYVQGDVIGTDEAQVPALHVSASIDDAGHTRVTLANLSASQPEKVCCHLSGGDFSTAAVRYIAGGMDDCNRFDDPAKVSIKTMPATGVRENGFTVEAPPCAVLEIVLS